MTRKPFTIPAVDERIAGLTRRPDGRRHHVDIIEQELLRAYEIRCTCGTQTWTPWGAAHAHEIAALHLWSVGA